ncbi:hypothetical protein [Turneriella parva]|uniref:Uncharacterized protein n=1 Tax=Turneriella parva (strain ATCC BAA-1111 / DSM 21527 / NCTC 11395 / H) TaxID=869212 RepID=I4BAA7_TURPD|nr:hypothetical protein [Turneriella parva]AFM14214.1 hypothetical protein Turpa_3580 [Turneriella parva DSM 21527]
MNTIFFGTAQKLCAYLKQKYLPGETIFLPEAGLSWGDCYIWGIHSPDNELPQSISDTRMRKNLAILTLDGFSSRFNPLLLRLADESERWNKELVIHSEQELALLATIRSRFHTINQLPVPAPPRYWEIDEWPRYLEKPDAFM